MKTILVDDEQFAIDRLKSMLNSYNNINIIADYTNPKIALKEIIRQQPDIVFIDIEMPEMSGFDLVKSIKLAGIKPKFIFVTAYDHYAIKAIKQKAFDYILKPIDIDELSICIDRIHDHPEGVEDIANNLTGEFNLTKRETEILILILKGAKSQEIANLFFISKHTVDTHRRNILFKIGVDSTKTLLLKVFS